MNSIRPTPSPRPTAWRRRAVTAAVALGTGLLAVSGVAAASATTSTPTPSTASPTPKATPSAQDSARLKADVERARKLEGEARRKALAAVREKARSGAYGDIIEQRTERRDDRGLVQAALPRTLRQDLAKIRRADDADKPAARAELRRKALAGEYGKHVQAVAERQQAGRG